MWHLLIGLCVCVCVRACMHVFSESVFCWKSQCILGGNKYFSPLTTSYTQCSLIHTSVRIHRHAHTHRIRISDSFATWTALCDKIYSFYKANQKVPAIFFLVTVVKIRFRFRFWFISQARSLGSSTTLTSININHYIIISFSPLWNFLEAKKIKRNWHHWQRNVKLPIH